MFGRFITTTLVMVTLLLVIVGNASARDASSFDPKKMSSVIAGSSLLGDPAIFINIGSNRKGGTVVLSSLVPNIGPVITVGLLEPGQNGNPSVQQGLFMNLVETAKLISYLRKGPDWEKTARENEVFGYSKSVGEVKMAYGSTEKTELVFVTTKDQLITLQLELTIAGNPIKYRFKMSAAQKFANQLQYFHDTAEPEKAPENPKGDAEKDKLFN